MFYRPYILEMMKHNNGVIRARDLTKARVARGNLKPLVEQGLVTRLSRGVYLRWDMLEDELLVIQKRYPKMIFSHDLAMCFDGMGLSPYYEMTVTVPSGYKVSDRLPPYCCVFYIRKELHELGAVRLKTSYGSTVTMYDRERTICDLIRSRKRFDERFMLKTLNRICISNMVEYYQLDEAKLMDYAQKLNVVSLLKKFRACRDGEISQL